MGFYSDLLKTNPSGRHCFDAAVLLDIGAEFTVQKLEDTADGEKIAIASKLDAARIATDITLHRNGRVGDRDLSKDTIVIPIEKLAGLPDAVQDALYLSEQTPGATGRRPGVETPKRGTIKIGGGR